MALDTRYRPQTYTDVLGQDTTVEILRQFVREGRGFHQSYAFCGQHGSGKTTLGRILARALLCETPNDGEPCDQCASCRSILERGVSECFMELDAATKSGKADVTKITEDVAYSTFSGKRRIYLFDEAHQLSKQALDALLKPMEDTAAGTDDKLLVCIFCTTEPSKMRPTVFSRCAPAFVIKAVTPEGIAARLATVCEAEGMAYEFSALVTIAALTECHIRDALKTTEGVAMLGGVTSENVSRYLRLDTNDITLDLLLAISEGDQAKSLSLAERLSTEISPTSAYERLSEACMMAYRVRLGVGSVPTYWNKDRIITIATTLGDRLLDLAATFADPPRRPGPMTLALDVAMLQTRRTVLATTAPMSAVLATTAPMSAVVGKVTTEEPPHRVQTAAPSISYEAHGIHVDPRAVRKSTASTVNVKPQVGPSVFREALAARLVELRDAAGRAGRPDVGGT